MKIKIEKEKLLKAINTCMRSVPAKSTMPILECILITAGNDEVHFTSNSTEMGTEVYLSAEIMSDGMVAVDAKTLLSIISKMPNGDITLDAEAETMMIKCGRSKFNIPVRDGMDFPNIENIPRENKITFSQEIFKETIIQTAFSASLNDTNRIMTGVLLSLSDNLKATALDGHRIAIREFPLNQSYEKVELIIPSKNLLELAKTLSDGDLDVYYTASQVAFSFDNNLITCRLIEGTYFDVSKIISNEHKTTLKTDRKTLIECLDRTTLLIKEIERKPVVMTIGDGLNIEIVTQIGSMNENIPAEVEGEELVIGVNPRFLIDALRAIDDDTVTIYFNGGKQPCQIKGDGYIYIVLPISLAV